MKEFDYRKIDPILHSRIRLAIMSVLIGCEKTDFTFLRDRVNATDGNMNTHLKKLENAGYINVEKTFVNRKPITYYQITEKGINAYEKYVEILEKFIDR